MMLRSRPQRNRFLIPLLVALGVVVLGALALTYIPGVRGAVQTGARPLLYAQAASSGVFARLESFLRARASLEGEIGSLKEEVKRLQLSTLELPILRKENERLRNLWGRRSYESSVLGRVLSHPNASPYDTLIVDVGKEHGVTSGNVVIVESAVVGRVIDVFPRTSVVQLFSAPGVMSEVVIGENSISARAEGRGGGNFVAEVPRGEVVSSGDVVMFPDFDTRILGTVGAVDVQASDPFQTVLFRLPINLSEVDFVEVVVEGAYPLPVLGEEVIEEEHDEE